MTIFHTRIHLSIPDAVAGQRMKIDIFFRSLAEEQGDKAIGIVLIRNRDRWNARTSGDPGKWGDYLCTGSGVCKI